MLSVIRLIRSAVLDDDMYIPQEVIERFTKESESITRKREEAIAWMRSFKPSKYVLDGANVSYIDRTQFINGER